MSQEEIFKAGVFLTVAEQRCGCLLQGFQRLVDARLFAIRWTSLPRPCRRSARNETRPTPITSVWRIWNSWGRFGLVVRGSLPGMCVFRLPCSAERDRGDSGNCPICYIDWIMNDSDYAKQTLSILARSQPLCRRFKSMGAAGPRLAKTRRAVSSHVLTRLGFPQRLSTRNRPYLGLQSPMPTSKPARDANWIT